MKITLGAIIGFVVGAMIWFPYGIMYTVQANSDSNLVRTISVIKWVIGL